MPAIVAKIMQIIDLNSFSQEDLKHRLGLVIEHSNLSERCRFKQTDNLNILSVPSTSLNTTTYGFFLPKRSSLQVSDKNFQMADGDDGLIWWIYSDSYATTHDINPFFKMLNSVAEYGIDPRSTVKINWFASNIGKLSNFSHLAQKRKNAFALFDINPQTPYPVSSGLQNLKDEFSIYAIGVLNPIRKKEIFTKYRSVPWQTNRLGGNALYSSGISFGAPDINREYRISAGLLPLETGRLSSKEYLKRVANDISDSDYFSVDICYQPDEKIDEDLFREHDRPIIRVASNLSVKSCSVEMERWSFGPR